MGAISRACAMGVRVCCVSISKKNAVLLLLIFCRGYSRDRKVGDVPALFPVDSVFPPGPQYGPANSIVIERPY